MLLGLTGGVSMGKSSVADMLTRRGAAVVDTDALARHLVEPGQPALVEIGAEFGIQVLDSTGALNRKELARMVFADPVARSRLESILHPRITRLWQIRITDWRRMGVRLGVVVIPLLFETDAARYFDAVVCVACSAASQQERMAQRGWTPEEGAQRIAAQMPIKKKMELSDYLVWAEGGLEVSEDQIKIILDRLTSDLRLRV